MRFKNGIKPRIFGAYLLVLGLGAGLSALVFLYGDAVRQSSRSLVESDIPELQAIADLDREVLAQEALLHRYFLNRDRRAYLSGQAGIDALCRSSLDRLGSSFQDSASMLATQSGYDQLRRAALALDRALTGNRADQATARRHLLDASAAVTGIHNHLKALAGELDTRIAARSAQIDTAVAAMQVRLVLFAGGILIVSLFVGVYINAYINDQDARRRLAMFPERNPNPILRLSADGEVLYANPASQELLLKIGAGESEVRALLPDDYTERLRLLRQSPAASAIWEYGFPGGRSAECGVHWLADLNIFHVYVTDVTERRRAQEQVIHQAYHDTLTGLPNRRMFEEQLEHLLYAERRGGMRAAFFLLGLDRFQVIIESLGHAVGDALLQAVGQRLEQLRTADARLPESTLYRLEGDRFALLLHGFETGQAPVRFAEQVLAGMRAPFYVQGREHHMSLSIGISVYPLDGLDAASLLRNAETAMQRVKQKGGASFELYTRDMNERAAELLGLENELRHAEEHGELCLYYHPQVEVDSGQVIGMEALIRWRHPKHGLLSPARFMPLAEESGLIVSIGDWALRNACRQAAAWRNSGLTGLVVAVNISSRQFTEPGLPERVQRILEETGLPASSLELEITESVAMQDVARTIDTLEQLKQTGVQLSVDDFGTGFSSLSYLKRFPIDKLKIDQSFVRGLPADEDDVAIVRAVVALGQGLKLRVIAEGVERAEQLAVLRALRCDEYQGYLFSKPLPAEAFREAVEKAVVLA